MQHEEGRQVKVESPKCTKCTGRGRGWRPLPAARAAVGLDPGWRLAKRKPSQSPAAGAAEGVQGPGPPACACPFGPKPSQAQARSRNGKP
ncbi:uncharacterized protein UV8b_00595 [Ustilaginoidea virens]|uniref:Uncharacterized protein n=1 Tax=Ustilaginoidea virens TaxID=1159556 RepID=A0A8E5HJ09_USTVR|nr:uncharacterized protein UV8b_00595 [Ustilaginoidea virens]QUC16354.1 hypothetical protein UV8b_00595 [Ustilaginoidea virens]